MMLLAPAAGAAPEELSCTEVEQFVYCERGLQEDLAGWTAGDVLVARAVIDGVDRLLADLRTDARPVRASPVARYALTKEDRQPAVLFLVRASDITAQEEMVDALHVAEVFGYREILWVVHSNGNVEDVIAREAVQARLREIAQRLHDRIMMF